MIVIERNVASLLLVALLPQAIDNHIVGARPYATLPVAAFFVVFRIVGAHRWHHARTLEFLGIV